MYQLKNSTLIPDLASLISRLPEDSIPLWVTVVDGISEGRLSIEETDTATKRMLAGDDKHKVMRELTDKLTGNDNRTESGRAD